MAQFVLLMVLLTSLSFLLGGIDEMNILVLGFMFLTVLATSIIPFTTDTEGSASFQTSLPKESLGRLNPNFIFSLRGMQERKFGQMVLAT